MPVIPLFNGGERVKAPAVLPSAENRRLLVPMNLNGAAQGFATPQLPYALADRSGGQAMGKALQQVGGVMETIALKKAEALNIRHVAEADAAMDQAFAEFENWKLSNPDETKWEAEWRNRMQTLPELVMHDSLSPDARDAVDLRLKLFNGKASIRVATDVAKTAFQKAGETLIGQALKAYEQGDTAGGSAYISEGVKRGMIPADTGVRYTLAGEAQAKAKRLDDLSNNVSTALMNERPDQARELVAASTDLSTAERENKLAEIRTRHERNEEIRNLQAIVWDDPNKAIEDAKLSREEDRISELDRIAITKDALQRKAELRRDAVNYYLEQIAIGNIPTKDALDKEPHLTDYDRAHIANKALGDGMNDKAAFASALSSAMNFDPSRFPDEQTAAIAQTEMEVAFTAAFDGPMLARLKKELTDAAEGKTANDPLSLAPALAALNQQVSAGGLGEFEIPMKREGNPVTREPRKIGTVEETRKLFGLDALWPDATVEVMENDGQPVPVTEVDPILKAQAADKQDAIQKELERLIKAKVLTTPESIMAKMWELYHAAGGKAIVKPAGAPALSTDGALPPVSNGGMDTRNTILPPPSQALDSALSAYGY